MAKRAPANPDQFEEAAAWFRSRTPVTPSEWQSLNRQARAQAFTVAGAVSLRVVQLLLSSIGRAIEKGQPLDAWKRDVRKSKTLAEFASKNGATLSTAFVNANQTAYNAGRWRQFQEPDIRSAAGFLRFDAILDPATTRLCEGLNGTILPNDHPWWLTSWPPLHHRCRSSVRAITAEMAERLGGVTVNIPRPTIPNDWGLAPPLRAGQVWEPSASDFDPAAWAIYQRNQERMKARWARREAANDNAPKPERTPRKD